MDYVGLFVQVDDLAVHSYDDVDELWTKLFKSFWVFQVKFLHEGRIILNKWLVLYNMLLSLVANNRSKGRLLVLTCQNLIAIVFLMVNHDDVVFVVQATVFAEDSNFCGHSVFELVSTVGHHLYLKFIYISSRFVVYFLILAIKSSPSLFPQQIKMIIINSGLW